MHIKYELLLFFVKMRRANIDNGYNIAELNTRIERTKPSKTKANGYEAMSSRVLRPRKKVECDRANIHITQSS